MGRSHYKSKEELLLHVAGVPNPNKHKERSQKIRKPQTTCLTVKLDGCAVQWVLWDGHQDTVIAVTYDSIQGQTHSRTGTICQEYVL